jgi:CRISPR/Cas system CMR subunit Cmr4 (Cas7 group RAMP superfamily)
MTQVNLLYKKYRISLEVLSAMCTGGGETSFYSSDEYFISQNRMYFINTSDIFRLNQQGLISNHEVENWYSIIEDDKVSQELKEHLKSISLKTEDRNKLNIHKFAYIKNISNEYIEEIPVIMGSTIKGLFRHGLEISSIEDVRYEYYRNNNKLKLKCVKKINGYATFKKDNRGNCIKDRKGNKLYMDKMVEGCYIPNDVQVMPKNSESICKNKARLCFRNTIFDDMKLSSGDMVIEKVSRYHRKTKKQGTPQYFEAADKETIFLGDIVYKLPGNKNSFTPVTAMFGDKTAIEIAFQSLRKYYDKVIEIEEKFYTDDTCLEKINEFYEHLKAANSKENTLVCKLGYSGAVSKTLIPFENTDSEDEIVPYTLNIIDRNRLPFGWVKITLEEIENEN